MKRPWLVGLIAWMISAVIFMAFAAFLMRPWEQERELIYSLYFPQVSSTPTLAEKQELTYRWFHRQDAVEVKRDGLGDFKALKLVFYDYDLNVSGSGFSITYLGLAENGRVYHAVHSDGWIGPYRISSHTLSGDQLYLRLERSDQWVAAWLGIAALYGVIPGMVAHGFSRIRLKRSKATIG